MTETSVRPQGRDQAIRWNSFNNDAWKEHFWPILYWPDQLVRLALSPHLHHRDRWFLFQFFVANGLEPNTAAAAVLSTGTYDDSAIRHIQYLKGNWTKYNTRYWCMYTSKYCQ